MFLSREVPQCGVTLCVWRESPLASLGMRGVRTPNVGFPQGISSRSSAPLIPRVSAVFSHTGTFERPIQRARSATSGVPKGFAERGRGIKLVGPLTQGRACTWVCTPLGLETGLRWGFPSHRGFLLTRNYGSLLRASLIRPCRVFPAEHVRHALSLGCAGRRRLRCFSALSAGRLGWRTNLANPSEVLGRDLLRW